MTNNLPLISSTDIEKYGIEWGMVDNFQSKMKDRRAMIVNNDVSTGDGIHWFVIVPIDNTVYIIDPLGSNNRVPTSRIMFDKLKQMGYKYKYYDGQIQYDDSVLCGYFSIMIANEINNYDGLLNMKVIQDRKSVV